MFFPEKAFGIKWPSTHKALGIIVGAGDLASINWRRIFAKVTGVFDSHCKRNLSVRGRAIICNTLAFSKIWYVGRIIPIPKCMQVSFFKPLFHFIWGGKMEALRRDNLYLPPDQGGVGLIHFCLKLQAMYIMHIVDFLKDPSKPWACFIRFWLGLELRSILSVFFLGLIIHYYVLKHGI